MKVKTAIFALVMLMVLHVACAQTTKVYVDPPESIACIGESFTINVNVADVVDLFSWTMKLSWDPSILECTNV